MALDSVEQERIELIKGWWQQNKLWVSIAVLVFIALIVGWLSWKAWQQKQNQEASQIYANFEQVFEGDQATDIKLKAATGLAEQLHKNYASSAFSWMAGLTLAKHSYEKGDLSAAEQQLKLVFDSAKAPYRALAALDLMSLYIEQKKYDAALGLSDWSYPDTFSALFEDRKGDIYLAQKNLKQAKEAYQKALDASATDAPLKEIIHLKLAALGV